MVPITLLFILIQSNVLANHGQFKQSLDDMEVYFNGPHSKKRDYYSKFYKELVECFEEDGDTELLKSQDHAWSGLISYFYTNGAALDYQGRSDYWNDCSEFTENTRCTAGDYLEYHNGLSGKFGKEEMVIYEPCNYASNIAYYHTAKSMCNIQFSASKDYVKALKRSFATLGVGSSFLHGSHTFVGYSFDRNMIAIIAYLSLEISVSSLPSESSILKQLSTSRRSKSAIEVADEFTKMLYQQPVV